MVQTEATSFHQTKLKYTKEKPTESGYYWYKYPTGREIIVYVTKASGNIYLTDGYLFVINDIDGEWCYIPKAEE